MIFEKISPEERLFEVIQEQKKSGAVGSNVKKGLKINFGVGIFKTFRGRLKTVNFPEINFTSAKGVLLVILAGLFILEAHYVVNKKPDMSQVTRIISKIQSRMFKQGDIEDFKSPSFYPDLAKKRDIFRPMAQQNNSVSVTAGGAEETLKELIKNFKIAGISWGETPRVMIKDEKEQNIYFLKQGQQIGSTQVEVKLILKEKIVINYHGAEMELL